jgi:hypothetical protein
MSLKNAFKWAWDAIKGLANTASNLTVSWLKAIQWTTRAWLKVALRGFLPLHMLAYKWTTELAKNIPRWVWEKYKSIHEKTLWKLEKVVSFSGGAKDIKEAIAGDEDYNIFDRTWTNSATEETKIMAKAELEKAKMQNDLEIKKMELEEKNKSADRKFELEKIRRTDNKEERADRRKNRTERLHDRHERTNKNRELQNGLAIAQAWHETTRHGVEQATRQEELKQLAEQYKADQERIMKQHEADQKLEEKRVESWDKQHEATQATRQEELKQLAEQYKADQERIMKQHEADQKLEEKRVESWDKQHEATQATRQEELKQLAEQYKADQERIMKQHEADQKLEEERLRQTAEQHKADQETMREKIKETQLTKRELWKNGEIKIDATTLSSMQTITNNLDTSARAELTWAADVTVLQNYLITTSSQIWTLEAQKSSTNDISQKTQLDTMLMKLRTLQQELTSTVAGKTSIKSMDNTLLSNWETEIGTLDTNITNKIWWADADRIERLKLFRDDVHKRLWAIGSQFVTDNTQQTRLQQLSNTLNTALANLNSAIDKWEKKDAIEATLFSTIESDSTNIIEDIKNEISKKTQNWKTMSIDKLKWFKAAAEKKVWQIDIYVTQTSDSTQITKLTQLKKDLSTEIRKAENEI